MALTAQQNLQFAPAPEKTKSSRRALFPITTAAKSISKSFTNIYEIYTLGFIFTILISTVIKFQLSWEFYFTFVVIAGMSFIKKPDVKNIKESAKE